MTVSEPTLGYIRLQWWREQFEAQAAGKSFAAEPALRVFVILQHPISFMA